MLINKVAWCGIFKDRIVGPFFFRNTMNSERSLEFLNDKISDFINNLPIIKRQRIWYQHDGAPCYTTRNVREYPLQTFNGRVLGRFVEFAWPARYPHLNPLDFFLWIYLKQKVYVNNRPFDNIDHLERTIQGACDVINPAVIRNVIKAFSKRTIKCLERNGGQVEMYI